VNERNNIIGRKNIPKNKLLLNESFMYFFDNSILSNKNPNDKTIIHFIWKKIDETKKIFKKSMDSNLLNLLKAKKDTDKAKTNTENKKNIKLDNVIFSLEYLRLYF